MVIGDLFDDAGALERGLARLRAARHDVLIVQTLDPAELTFDFRDATEFVGLETGARLPADPAALRQAYLDALQTHLHAVQHATRRLGFDYLLHATDQPVGPALAAFIARRSAALSKSR